jgi:TolB protein
MRVFLCLLITIVIFFSTTHLKAGVPGSGGNLQVVGEARNKLIPVALIGYSGEVASVLKFDLEVMGCKVVPEAEASFTLKGAAEGAVKGALMDKAGNFGFNRKYAGGVLRDQAHALSDDVIKALTGKPGVAQTRVLFKMKTGNRSEEVFLSDFDGHKPVALTNDKTLVGSPKWSPDNSEVYYTLWLKRGGIENTTVLRQNMKTGARDVMARYRGLNTGGVLSPQGFLAMILSKGGSPDVYVAPSNWEFMKNLKGEGLNRITATKEEESGVSWSPDGQWLCFATRARGKRMLVKVAAQGGNMIRVPTNGVLNPSEPSWSPDGKWIAFTSQMGGFNVCVVPSQGGEAKVIASGEGPTWAPNSRNLIFTRRGVNKRGLAIVDVPTKQVKMLPAFAGSASQPAWGK